jgi:hypothetical protein
MSLKPMAIPPVPPEKLSEKVEGMLILTAWNEQCIRATLLRKNGKGWSRYCHDPTDRGGPANILCVRFSRRSSMGSGRGVSGGPYRMTSPHGKRPITTFACGGSAG